MKNLKIAINISRFNEEITNGLLKCCLDELKKKGIKKSNIHVFWVPGAYELPFASHELALSKKYHAIINLGCIIKGQTSHDQHIANWVSQGLGEVSLKTRVPVLFGVLTPNNESQGLRRSRPGPLNRGKEVAEAALHMIKFKKESKE